MQPTSTEYAPGPPARNPRTAGAAGPIPWRITAMKDQESVRAGGGSDARPPGAGRELVPLGEAVPAGLVGFPRPAVPVAAPADGGGARARWT